MRVVVTGASGFVGGAVARGLVADGHEVWTSSRRDPAVDGARHLAWDLTTGPLADPPPVDAVVHAGAAVSDWCALDVARATNVAGTLAVRDTFPGARFVHVSSGSVYDPYRPSVRAREDEAPVARYLDAYGTTKALAERALARDVARHPDRGAVVVLRPHAVYGPGDSTLLPRVEAAVRRGRLVLPGGGRVLQSLTHVDTLLAAARAAVVLPDAAARAPGTGDGAAGGPLVVNVADAEPVVLRDALADALRRRGTAVRVVAVPVRPAWALAGVVETVARRLRRPEPPRLTRYALSHLAMERTYDLTVLRDVLGVDPPPTSFAGAHAW
ncbi:NAD-dependent epimerase/dehydratase family protein [Cellulosimicrobium funkei]|uniref:NAD(P)-dependent oxidoreductase n=1 Tax=Cellulosimicrobium funkei TaxID=264251 RepID=A0A4Y8R231_9MICO|nr:NAD(P)-dependent oxidoreductase [Cellulosimicrobium funkei]TFF10319.1 NAD(P)-dependent oxidoreductase [Cellulosimicrobium funkei]TGA73788.1 NAD(P)-dependent oxidoreductase [Cellulosimicrobium terreum]